MPLLRPILLCLLCVLCSYPQARAPNFIIIFADDLGYGDLGSYGSTTIRTPNLDQMAAEGLRFTDFYATAPFCSPSRASILTGRYPVRAGVPNVLFPTEDSGLPLDEVTIAELIKAKGYATAAIGKWHLGAPERFRAHRHGFDFFYGLPYSNDMYKYPGGEPRRVQHADVELPLMENDEVLEAPVNQRTLTMRYTGRAIEFIRDHRDEPFFLYLPHTFPHTPSYSSGEYEGRSPNGLYADTVEELDASTGEILRTLDELDLARQTLVVFTSDNGPSVSGTGKTGNPWGPRGGGGSPGSLRGHKGTTWEGGMRVPAIFRWPGRIAAGETAEVASIADLLPTFAGFAGVALPRNRTLDGVSLVPLLTGDRQSLRERLFCYYFGAQLQAVRLGRWKLILKIVHYPAFPASIWYADNRTLFERHYRLQTAAELYDLEADISESQDVSSHHPEVVQHLTALAGDFDRSLQADIRLKLSRERSDKHD